MIEVSEQIHPMWKRLAAGVPLLLLTAAYVVSLLSDFESWWVDRLWLSRLIPLEFLAIHGGVLMSVVVASKPTTSLGRVCQFIFFLWLASFYSLFALELGGVYMVVAFYAMTLSTYLGFLLDLNAPDRFRQLFLRWIVSFLLFMIPSVTIEGVWEMPNLNRAYPSLLLFGAIYFGAMAVVELVGFYDLNVWARIANVLEGRPKTPPVSDAASGSDETMCPACRHPTRPDAKQIQVAGQVGCLTATIGVPVVMFLLWKLGEIRSKDVFMYGVVWWGIIGFGASAAGRSIGGLIAQIRAREADAPEGGWCRCASSSS